MSCSLTEDDNQPTERQLEQTKKISQISQTIESNKNQLQFSVQRQQLQRPDSPSSNVINDIQLNQQPIIMPQNIQQVINDLAVENARLQFDLIPFIPISDYKFYLEICLVFFCLIEMIFFICTYIHVLWLTFYCTLGYWRHKNWRKTRFFGQLCNLTIWIIVNFYVFGGKFDYRAVVPLFLLFLNLDYYFVGSGLLLTFICYFTYILCECVSQFKLKRIQKRLKERRKMLLDGLMDKMILEKHQKIDIQQGDNSCSICLEILDNSLNLQEGNQNKDKKVLSLTCNHHFHYNCIKLWLDSSNQCPICRRDILEGRWGGY